MSQLVWQRNFVTTRRRQHIKLRENFNQVSESWTDLNQNNGTISQSSLKTVKSSGLPEISSFQQCSHKNNAKSVNAETISEECRSFGESMTQDAQDSERFPQRCSSLLCFHQSIKGRGKHHSGASIAFIEIRHTDAGFIWLVTKETRNPRSLLLVNWDWKSMSIVGEDPRSDSFVEL